MRDDASRFVVNLNGKLLKYRFTQVKRVRIYGNDGNDAIAYYEKFGTILMRSNFAGGAGDDILYSGAGYDSLVGGAGDDTLDSGARNDTLLGGTGADRLDGDRGTDLISGGDGADHITGGRDADVLFGQAVIDIFFDGDDDELALTIV